MFLVPGGAVPGTAWPGQRSKMLDSNLTAISKATAGHPATTSSFIPLTAEAVEEIDLKPDAFAQFLLTHLRAGTDLFARPDLRASQPARSWANHRNGLRFSSASCARRHVRGDRQHPWRR
jgi:hypothetical protein